MALETEEGVSWEGDDIERGEGEVGVAAHRLCLITLLAVQDWSEEA